MLRITGDINFTDGFFDTGFGVGSSIKKGADPFENLRREKDDFWIGNFEWLDTLEAMTGSIAYSNIRENR